jgi:hypothetical protein
MANRRQQMATIIKEKSSGEYYFYFHLYGMETGIYNYTICGFNGSNFFVKETNATDEKDYKTFGQILIELAKLRVNRLKEKI